jgi:hypothetical protein
MQAVQPRNAQQTRRKWLQYRQVNVPGSSSTQPGTVLAKYYGGTKLAEPTLLSNQLHAAERIPDTMQTQSATTARARQSCNIPYVPEVCTGDHPLSAAAAQPQHHRGNVLAPKLHRHRCAHCNTRLHRGTLPHCHDAVAITKALFTASCIIRKHYSQQAPGHLP